MNAASCQKYKEYGLKRESTSSWYWISNFYFVKHPLAGLLHLLSFFQVFMNSLLTFFGNGWSTGKETVVKTPWESKYDILPLMTLIWNIKSKIAFVGRPFLQFNSISVSWEMVFESTYTIHQGVPYGGSRPSEPKVAEFHHHGAPQ